MLQLCSKCCHGSPSIVLHLRVFYDEVILAHSDFYLFSMWTVWVMYSRLLSSEWIVLKSHTKGPVQSQIQWLHVCWKDGPNCVVNISFQGTSSGYGHTSLKRQFSRGRHHFSCFECASTFAASKWKCDIDHRRNRSMCTWTSECASVSAWSCAYHSISDSTRVLYSNVQSSTQRGWRLS